MAYLASTFANAQEQQLAQQEQQKLSGKRCPARARRSLMASICAMQAAYSALEACPFPVIAAVHGAMSGG